MSDFTSGVTEQLGPFSKLGIQGPSDVADG